MPFYETLVRQRTFGPRHVYQCKFFLHKKCSFLRILEEWSLLRVDVHARSYMPWAESTTVRGDHDRQGHMPTQGSLVHSCGPDTQRWPRKRRPIDMPLPLVRRHLVLGLVVAPG